jgi:hypothetical protein
MRTLPRIEIFARLSIQVDDHYLALAFMIITFSFGRARARASELTRDFSRSREKSGFLAIADEEREIESIKANEKVSRRRHSRQLRRK